MATERKRYAHEVIGKLLRNPVTGLTYVPYEWVSATSFYVVVVGADHTGTYRPGGYNLVVSVDDVENDDEMTWGP